MISVGEALRIIAQTDPLGGTETVSVYDCVGRIAAEDLVSLIDQPPFPRSPLDGFAFHSEDVKGAGRERPARLKQVGYVPAGCGTEFAVGPGECVRIMTGGRIPADCDAVIGIEDAAYEAACGVDGDDAVQIYKAVGHFQNYVFAGDDFAKGTVLCKVGQKIDAATAGCLAAAGFAALRARRRPRVAILATGSEIAAPGSPLGAGKIYDSNSVYLKSRLKQLGLEADTAFCPDDPALLAKELQKRIASCDLVLTTGGVSVGDADYLPQILEELGASIRFAGVRLKPGSPLILAEKDGAQILCLSGNPYAAAATFELFARPLLAALSADPSLQMQETEGILAKPFPKGSPVPRYLRSKLENGILTVPDGHSSGQLLTMAGCNCLAELPASDGPAPAGTKLKVYRI
ncbi:MAG: molybdopterin molybdotransferase MoeA [Firmicutes bacterium]|nr:molybdopterin molybdotransferase MoeA [Bacillota bacterium]